MISGVFNFSINFVNDVFLGLNDYWFNVIVGLIFVVVLLGFFDGVLDVEGDVL